MAQYNSDGYIMLDFQKVDFKKTNQIIDGLFDRCRSVIGTNKFVLVINANHKTPLPSTVSITNGQYVIESCIYSFSISANDNLFIKRNDVPASDIINDNIISSDYTWSSAKIVDLLIPIDTVTGNPATFNTRIALPLEGYIINIPVTQEGSGTPSPDNVRPIVGYTEVNITANENQYTIPFGQTVYCGSLDVLTGVFTGTHGLVDIGNREFVPSATNISGKYRMVSYNPISDAKTYASNITPDAVCECYQVKDGNSLYLNNEGIGISTSGQIVAYDENHSTNTSMSDFATAMSGKYLLYELATPIEIQLTPTQISTIVGQNTISNDVNGAQTISYKHL